MCCWQACELEGSARRKPPASPQVFAKPSQPQKGNQAPVAVKVKFIRMELVAGWDAAQGGTAWPRGVGSLPRQRAGSRGGLGVCGGAGKGTRLLDEGRGAQPCQVPALVLGHRRGGMGPSAILSAANKLKIKLGTAQETSRWERGLRALGGEQVSHLI